MYISQHTYEHPHTFVYILLNVHIQVYILAWMYTHTHAYTSVLVHIYTCRLACMQSLALDSKYVFHLYEFMVWIYNKMATFTAINRSVYGTRYINKSLTLNKFDIYIPYKTIQNCLTASSKQITFNIDSDSNDSFVCYSLTN